MIGHAYVKSWKNFICRFCVAKIRPLSGVLFGIAANIAFAGLATNSSQASDPSIQNPPNFRAVISRNLELSGRTAFESNRDEETYPPRTVIFPADRRVTNVEISDISRKTLTILYGWAWQTCIRATVCYWSQALQPITPAAVKACETQKTFAIFVAENRVVDARTALVTDQCDKGNYVPLRIKRPVPKFRQQQ